MIKKILFILFFIINFSTYGSAQKTIFTDHQNRITFDWNFECGSLDSVRFSQVNREYDVERGDSTTQYIYDVYSRFDPENPAEPLLTPGCNWYYFRISGVAAKRLVLNFKNADTGSGSYSYDGVSFERFAPEETPDLQTIIKTFQHDVVYIAYFTPYSYSYLNERIKVWSEKPCVSVSEIGLSEQGRSIPLLTITNPDPNNSHRLKKRVYIHGRIHPSECPSSWHLDQMIEILCGQTLLAQDLRNHVIFYIVPFTNPDGVVGGFSRSNATGINLEVNWDSPINITACEVKHIKTLLDSLESDDKPIDIFLNMHSQRVNFVSYWVHTAKSTNDRFFKDKLLFSHLTTNDNPYFTSEEFSFSDIRTKVLEGQFWLRNREATMALTFETPYSYYHTNPQSGYVTLDNLRSLAMNNVYAIADYLGVCKQTRIVVPEPEKYNKRRFEKSTDSTHYVYLGDSFLSAKTKCAKIKYSRDNLPEGRYAIYIWSVGLLDNKLNHNSNRWIKVGEYTQRKEKRFKYRIKSSESITRFDNVLLVREE